MAKIEPVFADTEVYPSSRSAGGDNAYYHYCTEVEHQAAYAVCLKKIEDRKDGRLESIYSTCSAAIGQKRCPAVGMKMDESLAGHAMFYLNRAKMREFYAKESDNLGVQAQQDKWAPKVRRTATSGVSTRPVPPASVTPPPPPKTTASDNIYADALSAAVDAETSGAKAPTLTQSAVTNAPRPSVLELARRVFGGK